VPATGPLSAKLSHFVDEHDMSGAVILVADRNKVLDLEAVGYSDLTTRRPMRTDDLFWIASMSKAITATAMMMLVDEGRVRLDDPVEKYIPEFKTLKVAQKDGTLAPPSHPIQIHELLSHTSGLRFLNAADKGVIDSVPLAQSVQNDLKEPLLYDPGTSYVYSNEGIDTAGLIVQLVSGEPFEEFLKERLFIPLGMVDTTFFPTPAQLKRLAKSYTATKDKSGMEELPIHFLKYPLDGPDRYPAPGGGLFSTAHDVARFCQMLDNGGTLEGKTYLSTEAVRKMTVRETGPLVKKDYGFGLNATDGATFGHSGAFKTNMVVDHGQIRIFMVQQAKDWSGKDPNVEFDVEAGKLYPVAAGAH
jgi:CubicO group peptidase (beta-lactamase class C family)